MKSPSTHCLVSKIKGLASESKKIRNCKRNTTIDKKLWYLQTVERGLGVDTRHYLLAYGFIRNIPYKSIEAKCNQLPSVEKIWKVVNDHPYIFRSGYYRYVGWWPEKDLKQVIEIWLTGKNFDFETKRQNVFSSLRDSWFTRIIKTIFGE